MLLHKSRLGKLLLSQKQSPTGEIYKSQQKNFEITAFQKEYEMGIQELEFQD